MSKKVIHEEKYQQFTVELGGDDAELAYARPTDNIIDFTHTYVPKSERGNGMAQDLIEEGLNYARQNNLKVKATCPAVAKYVKQHPEHKELLC